MELFEIGRSRWAGIHMHAKAVPDDDLKSSSREVLRDGIVVAPAIAKEEKVVLAHVDFLKPASVLYTFRKTKPSYQLL